MTTETLPEELQRALEDLKRDYEAFEVSERGANGYVVFARNRISGVEVAIKFYYGAPGERRHDEPRLLASIRSPNVLPIIDARNLSEELAFFLTPRCGDGDLDNLIAARPSALQAIDLALGIATGASAIHAHRLIHRDLKPANVVCDNGVPLIADFGSVRRLEEGEEEVPASGHSVLYRPPESFDTGRYGIRGDVYQVGLITYQLLGGSLPYDPMAYLSRSDQREYSKLSGDFEKSKFVDNVIHRLAASGRLMDLQSLPPWVGRGAKAALREMTHPDPQQRLANMAEVAARLTQIRSDMRDWRWSGDIARLEWKDRIIELRPLGNGCYEPLQAKADTFRRIPGMPNGPLSELVKKLP